MSEIIIEKGIPLPAKTAGIGNIRQTVKLMEVGDSIQIPSNRVVAARSAAVSLEFKVVTKKTGDMCRVWRTA